VDARKDGSSSGEGNGEESEASSSGEALLIMMYLMGSDRCD